MRSSSGYPVSDGHSNHCSFWLFISPAPLCTDDLMEQLEISRGNASMNLRGLVDWGLIHRVHIRGDRKEYFTSETIVRQRRRREVEPIVETIGKCREMVEQEIPGLSGEKAEHVREYRERLIEMQEFLETVGSLINVALELGPKGMDQIARMLGMAKT